MTDSDGQSGICMMAHSYGETMKGKQAGALGESYSFSWFMVDIGTGDTEGLLPSTSYSDKALRDTNFDGPWKQNIHH